MMPGQRGFYPGGSHDGMVLYLVVALVIAGLVVLVGKF